MDGGLVRRRGAVKQVLLRFAFAFPKSIPLCKISGSHESLYLPSSQWAESQHPNACRNDRIIRYYVDRGHPANSYQEQETIVDSRRPSENSAKRAARTNLRRLRKQMRTAVELARGLHNQLTSERRLPVFGTSRRWSRLPKVIARQAQSNLKRGHEFAGYEPRRF